MTLKEIYTKMHRLEEKLYNSKDYKKEDLLDELNEIGRIIFDLPIMITYRNLSILYQETFSEPLFASIKADLVEKIKE